jgi:AraC-like DNA-binding protein
VDDVLHKPADGYEPRGRLDPEGFSRHVRFQTIAPPEDLRPFIEHGWVITWEGLEEAYDSGEVMHRPYVDLFISSDEAGIQGTFRGLRTYRATAGSGRVTGLRFWPGAFHAVWDGTIAEMQDRVLELADVFPNANAEFVDGVRALGDGEAIDALFDLVRTTRPAVDPIIEVLNEIIAAIETDENLRTVGEVAVAFGRSERWVQQLFREYTGIGAKWLLQRRNLLAAATRIRGANQPNWADLAYDLGYSSQQHFITHFRQVLGKTPVQYWRNVRE